MAIIPNTEEVAEWPRITATVRPDGTGSLTINGTEHPCHAATIEQLRTGVIARCAALAARLRRPVRLDAVEGGQTWTLAVRPGGVVQPLDTDGTIGPGEALDVHQGPCRNCRTPQAVTTPRCLLCGSQEPHRVTVDPSDGNGELSQVI